jgi:hypothetical protein
MSCDSDVVAAFFAVVGMPLWLAALRTNNKD